MLQQLNEVWDFNSTDLVAVQTEPTYKITEDYLVEGADAPEVDGKIILGKIIGPSFFGEGVSRNQRFYPRALWERQLSLPRIKEKLANRMMLGCIGHSDGPVTEGNVSRGEVSHIVTNLILREDNQGIAEILILNTPAGRNLYTLMKAGSRIKISTRAQGQFLEGETHNGLPIVDPASFILETLDFVIEPGFIETDPRLQESLNRVTQRVTSIIESRNKTNSSKDILLVENKKGEFKMDLQEALNEIRGSYKGLYEEQRKLREEAEEDKKEAEKEAEECKKELEECKRQLAEYQQIGEAADIIQTLQEYAELGFSSPTEAQFILSQLQEENDEKVDKEELEDVKKDIEEAAIRLAAYESLGTVEELAAIKEEAEKLVDKLDDEDKEEKSESLAIRYQVPVSVARRFVEEAEGDEEEAEKELEEALSEDLPSIPQGSDDDEVEDYENDNELPDDVNGNDVEAEPNVVEEALNALIQPSSKQVKNALLEGYKPGSIASSMFD